MNTPAAVYASAFQSMYKPVLATSPQKPKELTATEKALCNVAGNAGTELSLGAPLSVMKVRLQVQTNAKTPAVPTSVLTRGFSAAYRVGQRCLQVEWHNGIKNGTHTKPWLESHFSSEFGREGATASGATAANTFCITVPDICKVSQEIANTKGKTAEFIEILRGLSKYTGVFFESYGQALWRSTPSFVLGFGIKPVGNKIAGKMITEDALPDKLTPFHKSIVSIVGGAITSVLLGTAVTPLAFLDTAKTRQIYEAVDIMDKAMQLNKKAQNTTLTPKETSQLREYENALRLSPVRIFERVKIAGIELGQATKLAAIYARQTFKNEPTAQLKPEHIAVLKTALLRGIYVGSTLGMGITAIEVLNHTFLNIKDD